MDLPANPTIVELARALRDGRITATKLAEQTLARIDATGSRTRAFVRTTPERAMTEARAADARLASEPDAPLTCGIPYAVKDIFDVAGEVTGAGCPLLSVNKAETDCAAVTHLRQAGMVLVGKTRTSPLACEITGLNHSETPALNPWMTEPHIAGGSSSGSGAAVAAGLVPMALGSDTAGSVRVPAALCGITGHKTTLGQISRAGAMPLIPSLDTVGPLARTAQDASLIFDALRGRDARDPSTDAATGSGPRPDNLRGLCIALPEGPMFDKADPEIAAAIRRLADACADLGARVEAREVSFITDEEEGAWARIIAAEAWQSTGTILTEWGEARDRLTRWIRPAPHIDEADLSEARRSQARAQSRFAEAMPEVDIWLMPTTCRTTRALEDVEADLRSHSEAYRQNAAIGNFLNLCGVSVPVGLDAAGRPVGAMLCGRPFSDDLILGIGAALQAAGAVPDLCPPVMAD